MKIKIHKNLASRGFTLIELLVVVAIIGLLSSIVMTSLNSARAKARDAVRLSDMRQIKIALALYYNNNGEYPRYDSGSFSGCGGWAANYPGVFVTCWADLETKLSTSLSKLPLDPQNTYPPTTFANAYHYRTQKAGQAYYLTMVPENSSTYQSDEGCVDAKGSGLHCSGENWQ